MDYQDKSLDWIDENAAILDSGITPYMEQALQDKQFEAMCFVLDKDGLNITPEELIRDLTSNNYWKWNGIDRFNTVMSDPAITPMEITILTVFNTLKIPFEDVCPILANYSDFTVVLPLWGIDPSKPLIGGIHGVHLFDGDWEARKDLYACISTMESGIVGTPKNNNYFIGLKFIPEVSPKCSTIKGVGTYYPGWIRLEDLHNQLEKLNPELITKCPSISCLPKDIISKYGLSVCDVYKE